MELNQNSTGILLQGGVSDWTINIIKEYQENFPKSHILLSTWKSEKIDEIPCDIIQTDIPKKTSPFQSTINHQIMGVLAGLKKMDSDIIMKCRTDQFIHNKEIFSLYEKSCTKDKIMIPNFVTFENIDYRASDICQIGTRNVLLDYWSSVDLFDGSYRPSAEIYLTANYILKGKKDLSPWKEAIRKYFCVKDFVNDYQIEWRKMTPEWNIKRFFDLYYKNCKKPD